MKILVLEDNSDRCAAMQACLSDRLYTFDAHFFADANDMIAFVAEHAEETIAISLDHDLEHIALTEQIARDPGTGRDVADYLSSRPPCCPVLIHTSNTAAAVGMELTLANAGWKTYAMTPYGDLDWIAERWLPSLRRAILDFGLAHVTAGISV